MMLLSLFAVVFVILNVYNNRAYGHGHFWHISDLHLDQNYSRMGDPADMCHENGHGVPDAGLYGNFLCDSPQSLVNITIHAMKYLQPNPDFIVWTGDNLPHTKNPDPDWEAIFRGLSDITTLLKATFPNVPIFTCIGNHDTFPPNGFMDTSDPMYDGYLQKGGWDTLLKKESWSTFRQGGFYSEIVKPGLRIISLNTILWYTPNTATSKNDDPSSQFKWLEEVLRNSTKASEKVYIIGHVPPGYYNRANPGSQSDPTYHSQHQGAYLRILNKYSEIILGQLYGHLHMDMFQIFQFEDTGVFKSSSLLASSVTPWHFPDELEVGVPVNPSIRLVHYSRGDYQLMDYEQYYLNLTEANKHDENDKDSKSLYELLYKFTDVYKVPDLSTESLVKLYESLKSDPKTYDLFYHFLTAGKESYPCDSTCKVAQLCSIAAVSTNEYAACMSTAESSHVVAGDAGGVSLKPLTVVVSLAVPVILLMCIGCLVVRRVRQRRNNVEYEPFLQF